MNVKRFLSDQFRRNIDHKIHTLILNRKVNQIQHELPKPTTLSESKTSNLPTLESKLFSNIISFDDAKEMYFKKCEDMKIKPNLVAQKRFIEQYINSFGKKSLKFNGLGLGPKCIEKLIPILENNPQYCFLDLSLNKLNNLGVIKLSEYLQKEDSPLIYLDLRSNGIQTEGFKFFFQNLHQNNHLTTIDFSAVDGIERNKFGTQGCQALSELLNINRTISNLNLSMCGITSKGCEFLGPSFSNNESLYYLNLTANRFGSIGAIKLFELPNSFRNIKTLILSRNGIDDSSSKVICDHLIQNQCLKYLDLSENNLGLKFILKLVQVFFNNSKLISLSLSKNNLGPETVEYLGIILENSPNLKHLNLSSNPFKDESLIYISNSIKKNDHILTLDLSDTMMGDLSTTILAEALIDHKSLQNLYLSSNNITDKSGVLIAKSLENNITLSYLSLKNNELNDLTSNALIKTLKINLTINDIDLSYNDFSYKSYVDLMKALDLHKQKINSNISGFAQKHINWLKKEEQKLFNYKDEILLQEIAVKEAENESLEKQNQLTELEEQKKTEIQIKQEELLQLELEYKEISQKRIEFNKLLKQEKIEIDKKQKESLQSFEMLQTITQQLNSRLEKLEIKKTDELIISNRKLDDLNSQLEVAKEELKKVVKEALIAKNTLLSKESKITNFDKKTQRSKK